MSPDMSDIPDIRRGEVDWAQHLLGACTSGDPLRYEVVQNFEQTRRLRTRLAELEAMRLRARSAATVRTGTSSAADVAAQYTAQVILGEDS